MHLLRVSIRFSLQVSLIKILVAIETRNNFPHYVKILMKIHFSDGIVNSYRIRIALKNKRFNKCILRKLKHLVPTVNAFRSQT